MTYMNIAEGFSYVDDEYLCLVEQVKKQRRTWRIALKRVAMFFLALLVGASVWLAADEGARAAFQRWIREVFDNSVVYDFYGNAEGVLPRYELTWMPEGFVLDGEYEEDADGSIWRDLVYLSSQTDDVIIFSYQMMTDDIPIVIQSYVGETIPKPEQCVVNGMRGEYYPPVNMDNSSNLLWFDELNGIAFSINSTIDKDTALHIAEGVTLCKPEK